MGIVMSAYPYKTCISFLLCLDKRLDSAAGRKNGLHGLPVANIVNLPEIEIIRFHVPEGLLKIGKCALFRPLFGLARQKDIFSSFPKRLAVIFLAATVGTGRFKKIDTKVQRLVDQKYRSLYPFPGCLKGLHPQVL